LNLNFADTNWLAALYLEADAQDREAVSRRATVERFMRSHGGRLAVSHIVLLEARNVFSRVTGERQPLEWADLEADFDGKLYVDPMNWHLLRRECEAIFARYAWSATLGTFDGAIVASAKLAGGRRLLSFDGRLKALAVAEGMDVFPPLDRDAKEFLASLKR
jgi:predicted nucleic acid-binding protein